MRSSSLSHFSGLGLQIGRAAARGRGLVEPQTDGGQWTLIGGSGLSAGQHLRT
jgi:hypothetical protein